ncbi:hypothetical protein EZV73_05395 [Acidaminobacter sp. JC074]|uniref:amylo-alpha-1,6-glucosidase n=1 Tax=Acidaminobacter sp. JC074 TaxID=2530199 RepID=UPI001F117F40|nr:trehalase family glycosidase [Acidaminobacter sp. JC074]MCH4886991.1 hypothetical protein [Acidaminobacter sp. JC074]
MNLPKKWSPGCIFAYSGLNDVNTYSKSIVGMLAADAIGIDFNTEDRIKLRFSMKKVRNVSYKLVSSDMILANILQEKESLLEIMMVNENTLLGRAHKDNVPYIFSEAGIFPSQTHDMQTINTHDDHICLKKVFHKNYVTFALCISKRHLQDAHDQVEKALTFDFQALISDKYAYFKSLPDFSKFDSKEKEVLNKCFSVMKSQIYSPEGQFTVRSTTPDRVPHKNIWLWDSVFHSLGNKYISEDLAWDSIQAMLDTQDKNGFIPHMATPFKNSDITQPPVFAFGIASLYKHTKNIDKVRDFYPKVKAYLEWVMKNRDHNGDFLFEWQISRNVLCKCDECGMDNSPRFDDVEILESIDFSCFMAKEAHLMSELAYELGLKDDVYYWRDIHHKIKSAINDLLWDEEDGFYYDFERTRNELQKIKAISSFLPLYAGVCNEEQAKRLVDHLLDENSFNTNYPIPSISKDDATFGSDMWRGPVWVNYTYLIILGLKDYGYTDLAEEITKKTTDMIEEWYEKDGTLYEFYDSSNQKSPSKLNRKGIVHEPYDFRVRYQSIRDYGWTNSLYPVLKLEF